MVNVDTHIIRPEDSKEYISYQFKTLTDSLRTFDYIGMAQIVDAAYHVFMNSPCPSHEKVDTILLETQSFK